ncbi:DUF4126 domain-containing protein [Caenibius sp. WL]|uniref:DUF4126 domain-containing protein n=1 Tax=Caenibius sp. WL TaxID=2872646 RepID=UPI001C994262|nr:DUF4126 domain-containing protein [Caenibius sp. WL]QZP08400.1 DUF4126 domain-containing protein [Caenibius sp. WL]
MGIVEIIGLAGSISLLSGWRIYLCTFAVGLAMRTGWLSLPNHISGLDVLANPWVLGISAIGLIAEFFADKLPWLDSIWDTVHTLIRPVGGALLAMAIVDAQDPAWQVVSLLLGGGAALLSHSAKAGTRAAVNTSPEPFSNIALSTGEDVATGGLLALALTNPATAIVIAGVLLLVVVATLLLLHRLVKRLLRPPPPRSG